MAVDRFKINIFFSQKRFYLAFFGNHVKPKLPDDFVKSDEKIICRQFSGFPGMIEPFQIPSDIAFIRHAWSEQINQRHVSTSDHLYLRTAPGESHRKRCPEYILNPRCKKSCVVFLSDPVQLCKHFRRMNLHNIDIRQ